MVIVWSHTSSRAARSGVIGINGAAAHLVSPGDLVIIMAYGQLDAEEIAAHRPRVVHVDASNRIVALGTTAHSPSPARTTRSTAAPRTACAEPCAAPGGPTHRPCRAPGRPLGGVRDVTTGSPFPAGGLGSAR